MKENSTTTLDFHSTRPASSIQTSVETPKQKMKKQQCEEFLGGGLGGGNVPEITE